MSKQTLFMPGKVIDNKWIIIELIGKGAMGEVYRAHQINLKRDVAIKIISEEMLLEIEDEPEEMEIAFKRFQREVQTMAKVRHTNILNIFDYGELVHSVSEEEKTIEYIVMEYIEGDTLRFTMSEEGLDDEPELYASWIKKYFYPILDGVKAMHNHDIFHRDLKPENIFMDVEIPKIADFGLARSYRMKAVSNSMEMKGTLAYMPPEQFSDFRNANQTADIFSLGKILFEGFNGKLDKKTLPFKSVNIVDPETPFIVEMDAIIQKATSEDKDERYQTVDEFRSSLNYALDLNKTIEEIPKQKSLITEIVNTYSKWIWVGIISAIISLGAMTLWHFNNDQGNKVSLNFNSKNRVDHNTKYSFPEKSELKDNLTGRDGSQMVLTGYKDSDQKGENFLIYIDKAKINNFLYVDFLNSISEGIVVDNGILKHKGKILLYLGTGSEPEDQIIYQHNRFHLRDQENGIKPVTRVSFHGASEYAKFHGKELLNVNEWKFAYKYHLKKFLEKKPVVIEDEKESFGMMHGSSEKKEQKANFLDGIGLRYKEWVRLEKNGENSKTGIKSYSGVMDSNKVEKNLDAALRYQWEGFKDVGFRTKIKVK